MRFDVCLPELIEVSKEGGDGLKNCDGTVEVVEDFLKKEKLVISDQVTLPSHLHHWCCLQHKQQSWSWRGKRVHHQIKSVLDKDLSRNSIF